MQIATVSEMDTFISHVAISKFGPDTLRVFELQTLKHIWV